MEIVGECIYNNPPVLVAPSKPTPKHALYLSNIDDQRLLHFPIQYIYVFTGTSDMDALKVALSRTLIDYYPLAGRFRASNEHDGNLIIDCNAEGAFFAEEFLPGLAAREFILGHARPHKSWRKLLYKDEEQSFVCTPPLVIQVTQLSSGGTILCTTIAHCVSDAFGAAHFLRAWARAAILRARAPRRALAPRCPPRLAFAHPEYTDASGGDDASAVAEASSRLFAPPLSPVSVTFTSAHVARLKELYAPSSLEQCTSFEALAAHVWRAWVRALEPPAFLRVKLLFTMDIRRLVKPELPGGCYFGNAFVLACAESTAGQLAASAPHAARLVQETKQRVDDDYVRSVIDLLEVRRGCLPDLAATFTISSLTRQGLEDIDFGAGRPVHFGPLTSEVYCLFLPIQPPVGWHEEEESGSILGHELRSIAHILGH
uniref:Omega-hydroxypalmitate O-feruloyl transferase n=1 Tax=Oryza punctata TaxID=4537 RepID=A0A0E0JJ31_ORYPU